MYVLDVLDRRLIALLRCDGRAPIAQVANALHVSRGTAQARLDRLLAERVILGFTIRTGAAAEEGAVRAITAVQLTGRTTTDLVGRLHAIPEVQELHTTNGAWDLVAEIGAASLQDLDRALASIRSIPGVSNTETNILLRTL